MRAATSCGRARQSSRIVTDVIATGSSGQVACVARRTGDLVDDVEALGDLAEDRVVLRQLAGQVLVADEELATRSCSGPALAIASAPRVVVAL